MSLSRSRILQELRNRGQQIRPAQVASVVCNPNLTHVMDREPTHQQTAAATERSGRIEVSLVELDNTFFLSGGSRNYHLVSTRFLVACRDMYLARIGLERFVWKSHTHALDRASWTTGVAFGPTDSDFEVLTAIWRSTRQTESLVVLCRRGALAFENNGRAVIAFGPRRPRARRTAPRSTDADFE
jgi:hypothetical protein